MTVTENAEQHWACLGIEGNDSRSFLQGQLSNDVDLVSEHEAGFFALCTPKGRTLANFFIAQEPGAEPNNLLLLVPASTAEIVLGTLAKYIVFSKAELTRRADWQLSFLRLDSNFPYARLNLAAPAGSSLSASQCRDRGIVRLSETKREKEQEKDPEKDPEKEQQQNDFGVLLQRETQLSTEDLSNWQLDTNDRELALVQAGIGLVQESSSDEYVPQMLNMQLNHGISFTKGCYTGQEIVARAQYRGKIKRRMYRATCELSALQNSAAQVKATDLVGKDVTDSNSGKSIGTVITAAQSNEAQLELLAVLSLKEASAQKLVLVASESTPPTPPPLTVTPLTLLSLPYDNE